METILALALGLVYTLLGLMPSNYQRDSLQALLGLFLQALGHQEPGYCQVKSASALSRFLNEYPWSTRGMIRQVRQAVLAKLLSYRPKFLQGSRSLRYHAEVVRRRDRKRVDGRKV